MLRSIIALIFLPLIYSQFEYERQNEEVFHCHSHQIAPLGDFWTDIIRDSDKESCTNNNCMLMWGLTTENTTRIIAQGCSKGDMFKLPAGSPPMRNECPSGTGIGPRDNPILKGEEGAAVLRTLTHIQICLCQSDWCNVSPKKDGETCEGDDSPFCNPLNSNNEPESSSNYSVEAIPSLFPPIITSTVASSDESTVDGRIPSADPKTEYSVWSGLLTGFLPLVAVIFVIICAVSFLSFALWRKFFCEPKPDQDSLELLGYRDSKRIVHTSGRLNSIAQVTILTEVAQGYKQEGEDLIRESQAGGIHQIANWKYDGAVILGTGSFGAVYRVEMKPDYLVDAKVAALKTFSHMRSTHFFNESRALRYVHDFKNHPNIIQYLGRAVDCRDTLEEATWRIALELCEGGSLRDWITSTHITLSQYLEAASGILSALTFLHCEESVQTSLLSNFRGNSTDSGNPDSRSNSRSRRSSKQTVPIKKKFRIAHCDVNSRNILVRNPITGNVALSDFGLSLTDKEKRQEEVQIREIGTIRYLAPEMLQSQINLSDALGSLILADTYATGLVLWELLSRTVELYNDDSEVPAYSPPYEKELRELEGSTVNRIDAMIKFLHASVMGINSMLVRDPEARLTVPAMAEKVDTYRLARQRVVERRSRSREDSLLDETSGSN